MKTARPLSLIFIVFYAVAIPLLAIAAGLAIVRVAQGGFTGSRDMITILVPLLLLGMALWRLRMNLLARKAERDARAAKAELTPPQDPA
jgi:hypothetical protein